MQSLDYYLDGTNNQVKISGGKLILKLDKPKTNYLLPIDNFVHEIGVTTVSDTITISDTSTKYFLISGFEDNSYTYYLDYYYETTDLDSAVFLIYVDNDVTINGSGTFNEGGGNWTTTYNNVELKTGWNYLIATEEEITNDITTYTSKKPNNNYKWVVTD